MKFLTLLIIITSLNFEILSQNLTLNDMVKVIKMNEDESDSYLLNKGYTFYKKYDNEDYNFIMYCTNLKITNGQAACDKTVSLSKRIEGGQKSIGFGTPISKEYLNIKNQLKLLGFVYKETKYLNENTIEMQYKSSSYTLYLTSYHNNSNGKPHTSYSVNLIYFYE